MLDIDIGFDEEIGGDVGFSFGKLFKGIGKGIGQGVKAVGKASKSVVTSKAFGLGVGVLAVAFPVVGVPAAGAVAAANLAIKKVDAGAVAASTVQRNLAKLKKKAQKGDARSAHAYNAMQVALAQRTARTVGLPAPVPVAHQVIPRKLPTSLYRATPAPAAVALSLAAGGSELGRRTLAAVEAGKAVEVLEAIVVVPGRRPVEGRRVWIGKPPAGVKATRVNGAHAVTRGGYVLSGQSVFVG